MEKKQPSQKISSVFLVLAVIIIGLLIADIVIRITNSNSSSNDTAITEHLELENNGIFGNTSVDFQEVVLGEAEKRATVVVMNIPLYEKIYPNKQGLGGYKYKEGIVYSNANYTVDLCNLSRKNIKIDEEKKKITIFIPHTKLQPINVSLKDGKFSDTKGGILPFSDIKFKIEDIQEIEKTASDNMIQRLEEANMSEIADEFAKLQIYKIYELAIHSVAPEYQIEIEFDD